MKLRCIVYAVLVMTIYLVTPGAAAAGERAVLIKFRQRPGPSEQALVHAAGGRVRHAYRIVSVMAATVPEQELARIAQHPLVAYVEADSLVSAVDPLVGDEYGVSWGVAHIGSEAAHSGGITGAGIRVAVLDTGIDCLHEDLDANCRSGANFVEYLGLPFDPDNTVDDSWNSHGTGVAGIIAAERNGTGVVGTAPEAEVHAVKVLDAAGFGSLSWVIAGIEWAVANNMQIINMSLAGTEESQAFAETCAAAEAAGLLLVAAAGNTYGGAVTNPAAYSSVIAVNGTDPEDQPGYFSAIGEEVELAAPGVSILSAARDNTYAPLSGTSQAAPHVAGVAALILSAGVADLDGDGDRDNRDVRLMLRETAVDLGDPGPDPVFGHGLVNAAAAATYAPMDFLLVKRNGRPLNSAESIGLSAGAYRVTITSNGLRSVACRVYLDGVLSRTLSRTFVFPEQGSRQAVWEISAGSAGLEVIFVPQGKVGSTAQVSIAAGDELANLGWER